MRSLRVTPVILAMLLVSLFFVSETQAVAVRTFVSSTGSDANTATNCGRTTPCQHLNSAYSVTSPGGEVVALDSAGVGGVTITTAVTISSLPGQTAFINVPASTAGITISAGATDEVILRNLQISGANAASTTGVQLNSGNLIVDNCSFAQLTSAGVTLAGGATSTVNIRQSIFTSNNRAILAQSGAVNVEDLTIANNTVAIRAEGQGPDQDPSINGTTPRTTIVRVSGGFFSSNTTAFDMFNSGVTGTRPPGGCNAQNIFLRNNTNIVGSPTFANISGLFDGNGGCGSFPAATTIGGYSPQNQNQTNLANQ